MRLLIAAAFVSSLAASAVHAVPGKVVLLGDDWILSDKAFKDNQTDTEQFAGNLADFLGGSHYLFGSSDANAFDKDLAGFFTGYGRTVAGASETLTPELLSPYDAVFLAGTRYSGPTDAAILNSYVAGGGSIVLALGTGDFPGGATGEVAGWSDVMAAWGLGATDSFDGINSGANRPLVEGPGALDDGVTTLYWRNGHTVTQDPTNPASSIAVTMDFAGAKGFGARPIVGVYDGALAPVNPPLGVVPVPAALPMLVSALGALSLAARRRR